MRVLVAPLGPAGHLLPVLPFAHALRAAGHEVTFALIAAAEPPVREAGFATFTVPAFEPIDAAAERLGVDFMALSHAERDAFIQRVVLTGSHLEAQVETILALAREWAPDAVVWSDGNFPAAVVAERVGLPHACVQVFVTGLMPFYARFALRRELPERLDTLRAAVGLGPNPQLAAPYRHLVVSQFPPSLLAAAEPRLPTRVAVRPGSLEPPGGGGAGAPPAWLAELPPRESHPRVYATLGTLMRPADGVPVFRAILDGLAEEPVGVIVTTGPRLEPTELGPAPRNARVERYVPQERLLPHCDLVHYRWRTWATCLTHSASGGNPNSRRGSSTRSGSTSPIGSSPFPPGTRSMP